METPSKPRRQGSTVVCTAPITRQHLVAVLNEIIGPVTNETAHRICDRLAQDVGWATYRRSAPQQVETSENHSTAVVALKDARKKRKEPDEAEVKETDGDLGADGREKESGRRAWKKQKGHSPSERVEDTNDTAVAFTLQVFKDPDFLIDETKDEEANEASHPYD